MIYIRRKPFVQSMVPHISTSNRVSGQLYRINFSKIEDELLHPADFECDPNDKQYDLVYIVKENNTNPELHYSLRSICRFCTFRKIWIIGYKPNWVKDVEYIHTVQGGNKWKNSMINYETACNCSDISDDFILMNDDFFAIRPIINWKENTNRCLGTIDQKLLELKNKTSLSRWQNGFVFAKELLTKLNCPTQYNYETHLPIIINKTKFKQMLEMPVIKDFMKTTGVFHKRSIYKNLFPDIDTVPTVIQDVKLELQRDLDSVPLTENWLSVYDYVVGNTRTYPRFNKLIQNMFADKCRFEV